MTSTSETPEKAGGRAVLFVVLGLILLCGGAWAAAYFAAGDRVPRGTTVGGVEVGGLSRADAVEALQEEYADREQGSISFAVDDSDGTISASRAGLGIDHEASVDQAGAGRSWDPMWLWDWFTGGDDFDVVMAVDDDAFDAFLDRVQGEQGHEPEDGTVRFRKAQVKVTPARDGLEVDETGARRAMVDAFLSGDDATIPMAVVEPEISDDDVSTAVSEFANPAVSGPVTISFGEASLKLQPAEYTQVLALEPVDGVLQPTLREKRLLKLLDAQVPEHGAPVDASVALVGGKPQVIPGKAGVGFDEQDVVDGFLDVVAQPPGKRTLEVPGKVAKPEFTTADARALEIKEQVSTFTTYYPHANYRNVNLGRAAELINGTVLKPGETFSLNGTVGERTRENGFTEGYVINDGIIVADMGGGVSQIATTTFNAMFFAGLEDVEHKPHSFYIDRYPVGREATVAWGAVDLRFTNDTPYGVLIDAHVTPSTSASSGVVTVSMYSTKYWDITTRTGQRYNPTDPEVRRVDTKKCHAAQGYGGFDIDVWRYFRKPGSSDLVRTEKFFTRYIPSDTVVCTHPDAEDNVT